MKKIFSILFAAMIMAFTITSCNDKELNVEQTVCEDTQYMVDTYGENFVRYEAELILNNYVDEECDGSIQKITNVFQVNNKTEDGAVKPTVVIFTHTLDYDDIKEIKGLWVEDMALFDEEIILTYTEAFQRMNESNYPKPHSKACTLRKEVGSKLANPQYIFGNVQSQLYVDALTGDVSDQSPAFNYNEEIVEENEEVTEEITQ